MLVPLRRDTVSKSTPFAIMSLRTAWRSEYITVASSRPAARTARLIGPFHESLFQAEPSGLVNKISSGALPADADAKIGVGGSYLEQCQCTGTNGEAAQNSCEDLYTRTILLCALDKQLSLFSAEVGAGALVVCVCNRLELCSPCKVVGHPGIFKRMVECGSEGCHVPIEAGGRALFVGGLAWIFPASRSTVNGAICKAFSPVADVCWFEFLDFKLGKTHIVKNVSLEALLCILSCPFAFGIHQVGDVGGADVAYCFRAGNAASIGMAVECLCFICRPVETLKVRKMFQGPKWRIDLFPGGAIA